MLLADMRAFLRALLPGILAVGLTACGGGGGSPNPVLGKLSFTTNENVALTTTLTATDPGNGQVTFTKMSDPASGAISNFTPAGAFTYTPKKDFVGSDSFGIQATDAAGNNTAGTITLTVTANQPPTATNSVQRVDGASLASINILANASDPDKDPLTVTIQKQPPAGAGTATVNADGSVNLAGLSGFKGVTQFTYRVTDPSGATADGTAAIFVGADPFRAVFAADASGNGANEVYMTDFASDPKAMTAATQGNLRLKGFAVSDNGATIVYRTEDTTSAANTALAFVKTSAPTQATSVPLPAGTVPTADSNGKDQFLLSPDGQWIAAIAGQGSLSSLYVINIAQPTVASQIQPGGASSVGSATFSLDSKSIYFLASGSSGTHRSLYFASLSSPGQTTLMSALSDPATTSDDVSAYAVSPDQTRIALAAVRGGKSGVFFVDATHPAVENQLNELVSGQSVGLSTIGLPPGRGGSVTVSRVAYVVQGTATSGTHPAGIYVAEVSTTPSPRLEIQSDTAQLIGLRPDDAAFLYTLSNEVSEAVIDTPGSTAVGAGYSGWYDSTGNIVLLGQTAPWQVLASTARGNFGTANQVGTTSLAILYNDVSGFDRGVAIIGQGPTSGTPPTTAPLQLVNALAPQGLLPLSNSATMQSPLQLTSYSSKIVSAQ